MVCVECAGLVFASIDGDLRRNNRVDVERFAKRVTDGCSIRFLAT